MDNKTIQKRRMMSYFIEATNNIIEKDGIEAITTRKVADIAGYNSATLYNYFENLDHLVFFASMKYLKDYALDLPNYLKNANNAFDKYLLIWKCFCYYSFSNPKVYSKIFFDKFIDGLEEAIKEYYSIFPEELGEESQEVIPMLLKHNIYERNFSLLEKCVSEGFLKQEDISDVNEMCLLMYQGMLTGLMNSQIDYSVDEAVEKTLKYLKQIVKSYR